MNKDIFQNFYWMGFQTIMSMFYRFGIITILAACSKPDTASLPLTPTGKRYVVADKNVSFILPDSSLKRGKRFLWAPDYDCSAYGESSDFFYNCDTTRTVSFYAQAYPCDSLRWHVKESQIRGDLMAKNRNQIAIERMAIDSATRTIRACLG